MSGSVGSGRGQRGTQLRLRTFAAKKVELDGGVLVHQRAVTGAKQGVSGQQGGAVAVDQNAAIAQFALNLRGLRVHAQQGGPQGAELLAVVGAGAQVEQYPAMVAEGRGVEGFGTNHMAQSRSQMPRDAL